MTSAAPSIAASRLGGNLTPAQAALWLGRTLDPTAPMYNMVLTWTIDVALDTQRFSRAFDALVLGSDALRTVFEEHGGIPTQRWLDEVPTGIELLDLSTLDDAAFEAWLDERQARLLDLSACAYDSVLVQRGASRFVWYFNQHHLICDITSFSLSLARLSSLYERADNGEQPAESWPRYADHVARQLAQPTSVTADAAARFWNETAASGGEVLSLFGRSLAARSDGRTVRRSLDLGVARSSRLRDLAREPGIRSMSTDLSLSQVFNAVLASTLSRLSGETRVCIGTPFQSRHRRAQRNTLGLFVNVLPVQLELADRETFRSLVQRSLAATAAVLRHAAHPPADGATGRLFNVVLNYLGASFGSFAGQPVKAQWRHTGHGDRHHALRVQVQAFEPAAAITVHFDFNQTAMDATAQAAFSAHFVTLLDALLDDRDQPIASVPLLDDADRQTLLIDFNATDASASAALASASAALASASAALASASAALVHRRFEALAASQPDAIALEGPAVRLTYAQANARANQLARHLQAAGIGRSHDDRVALCLDRSPAALVAMLGVLKAGAAYVTLDLASPPARLAAVLVDAGAKCVLADAAGAQRLPDDVAAVLIGAHGELAGSEPLDTANLDLPVTPDQLAYVIFTSGTTGAPKGAMVRHGGLANYVGWANRYYCDERPVDMPLFTSLAFDLSVTSAYLPLVSGGRVVAYPQADSGDLAIAQVIRDDRYTVIKLTPAHLVLLGHVEHHASRAHSPLEALIVGGEDLRREVALSVHRRFAGNVAIYNEYGPSETVVGSMIHRFDPDADTGASVPIGVPVANTQIYLLDRHGAPVPPGVTGELVIGGAGVARGYLNRPDLTGEKFIRHPLASGDEARLYRTGDLARWNAAGAIEFLGRADEQVKIKGVRIELGEIESALHACAGIDNAAARVVRRGDVMAGSRASAHCTRCGLPSNYPGTRFDDAGVCSTCVDFARHQHKVAPYFRNEDDLRDVFRRVRERASGEHDCVLLLSGGKDSTYMLYQVVREFGARPLVFSLDNGFISAGARENIERVTRDLGLELVWGRTPHMNAIFVESLAQHANVCNGCFKTIYTLSMNLARERGIPSIVTGLARGQLFETRLTDMFEARTFDPAHIDRTVMAARKAYHRMDDVVSRCLDVSAMRDDAIFENVEFIDFYRYTDVSLESVYRYLDAHVPWIRPKDTGRSTNCLINDVGIHVHKRERGYHNYALPYAWDVRLGHKVRESAMDELDDQIDEAFVEQTLATIGYTSATVDEPQLAVYYTADPCANGAPDEATIAAALSRSLPAAMMPTYYVRLDTLPLTRNGKVDRQALPLPALDRAARDGGDAAAGYVAPRSERERTLARLWAEVFGIDRVSVAANFFDLGGDSIISIQLIARAAEAGLALEPRDLFTHHTIEALARVAREAAVTDAPAGPDSDVADAAGPVPLTPVQSWWAAHDHSDPDHWNLTVSVRLRDSVGAAALRTALTSLVAHHAALRTRFERLADGGWQASVLAQAPTPVVIETAAGAPSVDALTALESSHDLAAARLIAALVVRDGSNGDTLHVSVHHLVSDGVSTQILLGDLERLLSAPDAALRSTVGPRRWAAQLERHANTAQCQSTLVHWRTVADSATQPLTVDGADRATAGQVSDSVACLSVAATNALLTRASRAFGTTASDLLLTALLAALAETGGARDWCVDVERHGRDDALLNADSSRTIGWFTTLHPEHLSLPTAGGWRERIIAIKEARRLTPVDTASYGVLRHGIGAVRPVLTGSSAANILFNFLGQPDRIVSGSRLFGAPVELRGSRPAGDLRQHALEVNVLVRDGALELSLTAESRLAQRLLTPMVNALESIISTCESELALTGKPTLTPSDVPHSGLDQPQLDRLQHALGPLDDVLPLSGLQQGIAFHTQMAPRSGFYALQFSADLAADAHIDLLERAWQHVVDQHPALRSVFVSERLSAPLQCVRSTVDASFERLDWRDQDPAMQAAGLARLAAERLDGATLATQPPSRMTLVQLGPRRQRLIWNVHHIAVDRRSMVPLFEDWWAAVQTLQEGAKPSAARRLPFGEYLGWAAAQDHAAGMRYWQQRLAGFTHPTTLRDDRAPGVAPVDSAALTMARFSFSAAETAALLAAARRRRITVNTVVQGAWAALLSRWSGTTDVVFGAIVPGRPAGLAGAQDAIGMYVNTLPARLDCDPRADLDAWLAAHQIDQARMRQFDYQSLVQITRASDAIAGTPLFETAIGVQHPARGERTFYDLVAQFGMSSDDFVDWNSLPLTVAVEVMETTSVVVKFDCARFGEDARKTMADEFERTLRRLATPAAAAPATLGDLLGALDTDARSTDTQLRETARRSLGKGLRGRRAARAAPLDTATESLVTAAPDASLYRGLAAGAAAPLVVTPTSPGVDLPAWCEAHRTTVAGWLTEHGALLFRGFSVDSVAAFEACVNATSTGERLDYRDRTTPRTSKGDRVYTSTVYPSDQRINLHNEGTYWARWPLKLYFCCLQPSTTGGRTPLADMRAVHDALPGDLVEEFDRRQFMLVRNFNTGFGLTWQEVFQTESRPEVEQFCRDNEIRFEWHDDNRLRTRQVRPAIRRHPVTGRRSWFNHLAFFHHSTLAPDIRDALLSEFGVDALPYNTCYGDGMTVPDDVVACIRAAYDRAQFSFEWQAADVLLLDNMSFAHGREAFTGDREVLAAMTEPYAGPARAVAGDRA